MKKIFLFLTLISLFTTNNLNAATIRFSQAVNVTTPAHLPSEVLTPIQPLPVVVNPPQVKQAPIVKVTYQRVCSNGVCTLVPVTETVYENVQSPVTIESVQTSPVQYSSNSSAPSFRVGSGRLFGRFRTLFNRQSCSNNQQQYNNTYSSVSAVNQSSQRFGFFRGRSCSTCGN